MKAAGTTVESVRTAPLHESFSLDARSSGSRGLRNAKFEFMDGTLRSDSTTHWDVHPNSTVGVVHVGHERHREKEHSLSASRVASAGDLMMENTLFVASFKPRVERTRQIDMYDRARADARPASIAYPVDVDIDARDLAKSLMRSTMSGTAMFTPDKAIPQLMPCWGGGHGQKKTTFLVRRLAKDHYAFDGMGAGAMRGRTLDTKPGVIKCTDKVGMVGAKLHALFPDAVPAIVPHGDAVLPGRDGKRLVRVAFAFRGKLLLDSEPIGKQCLSGTFAKYF